MTRLLPLPLLMLLLSGCATLNENECRSVDWRELGLRDGRSGYTPQRLAEHREACAKHGIRPDERLYEEGRRDGLREYCVLDNAVQEGLAGRRYQGVCPSGINRDFRDLNAAAYEVHDTRRAIDNTANRLRALEAELNNKKTSDKRRTQIRDEIRELDRQYDQLKDTLRARERDLDRKTDSMRYGSLRR
ncbi:MAG: DUF2799 domain-containing protein [Thiohalocapsa sp.]|nr:DUF2799 domain-containing protein [Thiohalocapsa sp.]MCF7991297.1 DUF2799 domain-containing protein [Thiohalocapsa sp.]